MEAENPTPWGARGKPNPFFEGPETPQKEVFGGEEGGKIPIFLPSWSIPLGGVCRPQIDLKFTPKLCKEKFKNFLGKNPQQLKSKDKSKKRLGGFFYFPKAQKKLNKFFVEFSAQIII